MIEDVYKDAISQDEAKIMCLRRDIAESGLISACLSNINKEVSAVSKERQNFKDKMVIACAGVKQQLRGLIDRVQEQLMFYLQTVNNQQCDKQIDQRYFKELLKLYDDKRRRLKQRILSLEQKVQVIQQYMLKNTHPTDDHPQTQFGYVLLKFKIGNFLYSQKLYSIEKLEKTLVKNHALKDQLKAKINHFVGKKNIAVSENDYSEGNILVEETKIEPLETTAAFQRFSSKKTLNVETVSDIDLLHTRSLWLGLHVNWYFQKVIDLNRQKNEESYLNIKLKSSLVNLERVEQLRRQENRIIEEGYLKKHDYYQQKKEKPLTQTDYLIYLKELKLQAVDFQQQGVNFYLRRSNQVLKRQPKPKGYSAEKLYPLPTLRRSEREYLRGKMLKDLHSRAMDFSLKDKQFRNPKSDFSLKDKQFRNPKSEKNAHQRIISEYL